MVQDFWEKRTEGADQEVLLLLLHAQHTQTVPKHLAKTRDVRLF